ncbi:hypothetical protein [Spirochaeta africana]|uniref:Lipoprotein n=1 Tax=Spirochaeta africana (strain ATCC 700263 / DSM 8902 / Z-7692) TaxID=889378 RepID=H9UGS8_SPIAZ|nr:hypothetical protein [Spirochaeta africana]AFG36721.1 hypothetical protein Spiaf_0621 [Spirochaeta africana DSM 8902]
MRGIWRGLLVMVLAAVMMIGCDTDTDPESSGRTREKPVPSISANSMAEFESEIVTDRESALQSLALYIEEIAPIAAEIMLEALDAELGDDYGGSDLSFEITFEDSRDTEDRIRIDGFFAMVFDDDSLPLRIGSTAELEIRTLKDLSTTQAPLKALTGALTLDTSEHMTEIGMAGGFQRVYSRTEDSVTMDGVDGLSGRFILVRVIDEFFDLSDFDDGDWDADDWDDVFPATVLYVYDNAGELAASYTLTEDELDELLLDVDDYTDPLPAIHPSYF